jgi:hypothetical protein
MEILVDLGCLPDLLPGRAPAARPPASEARDPNNRSLDARYLDRYAWE